MYVHTVRAARILLDHTQLNPPRLKIPRYGVGLELKSYFTKGWSEKVKDVIKL